MKKLNLEELALLAGVSKTTVSLILNGRAEQYRISPATQQKVQALAETHQFTPDAGAASLRSGRDRALGVVIPSYHHWGATQLLAALEPLVSANGDQLLIACSHQDPVQELAAIRQLLGRRVSGLVVVTVQPSATALELLPTGDVPLVVVGRTWPDSPLRQLGFDAAGGITTLTNALLAERRPRQLLLLNGPADHPDADIRGAALHAILANSQVATAIRHSRDDDSDTAAILDLACDELGTIPEVVIAASIAQLEGAMAFLTYHRNRWPASLTLACCEYHPLLNHLTLPCLSLRHDWAVAASKLLKLLQPTSSDLPPLILPFALRPSR